MLKVIKKKRKTNFLTTSGLRCLAKLPSVNVSAGCAHNCVYCYTKGYSIYPGESLIEVYENMAERIADEIKRKRRKPAGLKTNPVKVLTGLTKDEKPPLKVGANPVPQGYRANTFWLGRSYFRVRGAF
jgi:hypothetical protein